MNRLSHAPVVFASRIGAQTVALTLPSILVGYFSFPRFLI
jgi:hypothetical protein